MAITNISFGFLFTKQKDGDHLTRAHMVIAHRLFTISIISGFVPSAQ
jgi:hypothetical protein